MSRIYEKNRNSHPSSAKLVRHLLVKEMKQVRGEGNGGLPQYIGMPLLLPPNTVLQTLLDAESFKSPIFVLYEERGVVNTYQTHNVISFLQIGDLYFLYTEHTTYQVMLD